MKRVAFYTFGCRLNSYDTETIRTLLENEGDWSTVSARDAADLYVVNTCSVTAQADAKVRKTIRRLSAERPDAHIVVTGCYAQRAPYEIAELPGVSLILGAADRARVADEVRDIVPGKLKISVSSIKEAKSFLDVPITEMMERSRAVVKVQEGCNQSCTFCIVPQTRGQSRSRRFESVISQAQSLVEHGYTEIVVTGVHVGAYGVDFEARRPLLPQLLRSMLAIDGLERLRLSSIEPASVSDELIELMAGEPKFARHFHIPLQSGSNDVLARMQRGYDVARFQGLITQIAERVPDCGIGTDIIAGFPGESVQDFQKTFDCLVELPITYLHPFTYSVRPGSAAEAYGDQVPGDEKKRRTRSLKRLSQDKISAFRSRHLGRTMPVLLERDQRSGECNSGLTDNFLRVEVRQGPPEPGVYPVALQRLDNAGIIGAMANH